MSSQSILLRLCKELEQSRQSSPHMLECLATFDELCDFSNFYNEWRSTCGRSLPLSTVTTLLDLVYQLCEDLRYGHSINATKCAYQGAALLLRVIEYVAAGKPLPADIHVASANRPQVDYLSEVTECNNFEPVSTVLEPSITIIRSADIHAAQGTQA